MNTPMPIPEPRTPTTAPATGTAGSSQVPPAAARDAIKGAAKATGDAVTQPANKL